MTKRLTALIDAIALAARKHKGQKRDDEKTPYVSHVYGVAMTLALQFGVRDAAMLTAAILHDMLEDTDVAFPVLQKRFGRRIADWVRLLSKDEDLPRPDRETLYCSQLKSAPWQVKLIKYADMHDNLLDALRINRRYLAARRKKVRLYMKAMEGDRRPQLKFGRKCLEALVKKNRL